MKKLYYAQTCYDREGNEILEGDVLRFWSYIEQKYVLAEAQFDGTVWKFGEHGKKDIDWSKCVIIGNIYEHWYEIE